MTQLCPKCFDQFSFEKNQRTKMRTKERTMAMKEWTRKKRTKTATRSEHVRK
jgi:hypothetical protein